MSYQDVKHFAPKWAPKRAIAMYCDVHASDWANAEKGVHYLYTIYCVYFYANKIVFELNRGWVRFNCEFRRAHSHHFQYYRSRFQSFIEIIEFEKETTRTTTEQKEKQTYNKRKVNEINNWLDLWLFSKRTLPNLWSVWINVYYFGCGVQSVDFFVVCSMFKLTKYDKHCVRIDEFIESII